MINVEDFPRYATFVISFVSFVIVCFDTGVLLLPEKFVAIN